MATMPCVAYAVRVCLWMVLNLYHITSGALVRMNKLKRVAEHLLVVFNLASTHLLMTPTRPVCNFDVHSMSLIERNRFLLIHQIDYWIKSISFDR